MKGVPVITEKQCPECKWPRPIADFYACKSRPGGLSQYCKDCSKVISERYRKSGSDKDAEIEARVAILRNFRMTTGRIPTRKELRKLLPYETSPYGLVEQA